MKRALILLIAGTVLSGMAAFAASAQIAKATKASAATHRSSPRG